MVSTDGARQHALLIPGACIAASATGSTGTCGGRRGRGRRGGRAVGVLPRDRTLVHGLAQPVDGLKVHLLAVDLDDREGAIGIEAQRRQAPVPDVAVAKLGAATLREVVNALLRLDAFVEMLVPR